MLAFCFLRSFLGQWLLSAPVTQTAYEDCRIHTGRCSQIHLFIHKVWPACGTLRWMLQPERTCTVRLCPAARRRPDRSAEPPRATAFCLLCPAPSAWARCRRRPLSPQPGSGLGTAAPLAGSRPAGPPAPTCSQPGALLGARAAPGRRAGRAPEHSALRSAGQFNKAQRLCLERLPSL